MAKGEIARFFFCHYVFKKLSAAEASESVYMSERVKSFTRDRVSGKSVNLGFFLINITAIE